MYMNIISYYFGLVNNFINSIIFQQGKYNG
ncbi:hypothetical protein [Escherichia phage FL33]|uniref:Uncharacterized protein n=1 Tax=Escherichia phage FL33 TaxID=3128059 RepID=A0AAX4R6M5_9CAUD